MLEIAPGCEQHHQAVLDFAKQHGLLEQLQAKLDYLGNYACEANEKATRCKLLKDFAPHSYAFVMERQTPLTGVYTPWFGGGLIFHCGAGFRDGTLAVDVSDSDKPHWSVHT